MSDTCELRLDGQSCGPCETGDGLLSESEISAFSAQIDAAWNIKGRSLVRRFEFKGFAKPVYHANLCAWLADKEGHHPDLKLGWGYLEVALTSHEAGGLTANDFIWARKLDGLLP